MAWEPRGGRPRRTAWQEKTSAEIRGMRERRMGEEIKDFLDHAANCPNCSGQAQGFSDEVYRTFGPFYYKGPDPWTPKWEPYWDPFGYKNWMRKNGYLD